MVKRVKKEKGKNLGSIDWGEVENSGQGGGLMVLPQKQLTLGWTWVSFDIMQFLHKRGALCMNPSTRNIKGMHEFCMECVENEMFSFCAKKICYRF